MSRIDSEAEAGYSETQIRRAFGLDANSPADADAETPSNALMAMLAFFPDLSPVVAIDHLDQGVAEIERKWVRDPELCPNVILAEKPSWVQLRYRPNELDAPALGDLNPNNGLCMCGACDDTTADAAYCVRLGRMLAKGA